jgi:Abortive infection C-terminus
MEQVQNPIRFIGMDANIEDAAAVSTPQLQITSAAVVRALSDFEALISSKGGAVSGVDRIHTALHAYLREVCNEASIQFNDNADITALFQLIRQQHPKLQKHPLGVEAQKMLRALATIVDTLNPLRNSKSMAHPSEDLLDEPEAMLAANAVRSLLHYLNSKLQ